MFSCQENGSEKQNIVKDNTLALDIRWYRIFYEGKSYPILMSEEDVYYILKKDGKVKSKEDYLSRKNDIHKEPIDFNRTKFSNFRTSIVFADSSDQTVVKEWVRKIESDSNSLHKKISIDAGVSRFNRNSIFYTLLNDSFKIYQDDISGDYVLSK